MRLTLWLPMLLVALVAACDAPQPAAERLLLRWQETDGHTVEAEGDATLSLGPVWAGGEVVRRLEVVNAGSATLTLAQARATDGEAGSFQAVWEGNPTLAPGAPATLRVRFAPPAQGAPTPTEQPHRAVLALETQGPGSAKALLTLEARALIPGCPSFEGLDFGPVVRDESLTQTLTLHNPAPLPWQVELGAPSRLEGESNAFSLVGLEPGKVMVPAGGTLEVPVRFSPDATGRHVASLALGAGAACPSSALVLKGEGVAQALVFEPASVDCGAVPPGLEVQRPLRVRNLSGSAVSLTAAQSSAGAVTLVDSLPVELPSRGERVLSVRCAPTQPGAVVGLLSLSTSLARESTRTVPVSLFGGGPRLVVQAEAESFGPVAFMSTGPQVPVERTLVLQNAGTSPLEAWPLQVGTPHGDGSWAAPLALVVPGAGGSGAEEFSVVEAGPLSLAPGATGSLTVRLTPASPGQKKAELVLLSNDLRTPEVRLPLSAEVIAAQPCRYSVAAAASTFGTVPPGERRTLDVLFTNLGSAEDEVCIVQPPELVQAPPFVFSQPDAPSAPLVVAPGAQHVFRLRVAPTSLPQGGPSLQATLQVRVSSPQAPLASLPLSARVEASCLRVMEEAHDLGTLAPGCTSAAQPFALWTSCAGVEVLDVALEGPCGPSNAACGDFQLTLPEGGVPATLLNAAYSSWKPPVSVHAQQAGLLAGAVRVTTVENGATVVHVLPLRARATEAGSTEDVLFPGGPLKADVLFVVEDASGDGQMASFRFAEATQWVRANGVDWRLGVTGVGLEPENRPGQLHSGTGHPDRILTASTPDVGSQYRERLLAMETDFHSVRPRPLLSTLTALSAPLTSTANAGFLREDALLGVVYFTEDGDQSEVLPETVVLALRGLKGVHRPGWLTLNASDYFTGNAGALLSDVVHLTGGVKAQMPVDAPDLAKWVTFFARAFGQRERYPLGWRPQTPVDGHLQVLVDGVEVPVQGGAAWTYDASTNAVQFAPGHAPLPGQEVRARYRQVCQ